MGRDNDELFIAHDCTVHAESCSVKQARVSPRAFANEAHLGRCTFEIVAG
jgi:hypothetical protein